MSVCAACVSSFACFLAFSQTQLLTQGCLSAKVLTQARPGTKVLTRPERDTKAQAGHKSAHTAPAPRHPRTARHGTAPHRATPLHRNAPRPRPAIAELVVGVEQPARLHGEAAAADAAGEFLFEFFEAEAALFEYFFPAS